MPRVVCAVVVLLVHACGGESTSSPPGSAAGGQAGGSPDASAGQAGAGGNAGATGQGGSNGGSAGAAGATGGSAGVGGAAGGFNWHECASGADCTAPSECVQVGPTGFEVCTTPTPDPTAPCDPDGGSGPGPGTCCSKHSDCGTNELCVTFSGGIGQWNQCLADSCSSDSDCPNGFCAPRGVLGVITRQCLPAYCKTDAECTATSGGRCAPVTAGQVGDCATVGLFCVYPIFGGCTMHSDCPGEAHCEASSSTKEARCVAGAPENCPAKP